MSEIKEIKENDGDLNETIARERNIELAKIQAETEQLACIYQTVYNQLKDQGMIVDDIERDIEDSVGQTKQAVTELKSAEYYKYRSRIWGAIAVVSGVAIATVGFFALKPK